MAEQVITVPLLGGIDESVDPDQIPAPGMKELTNVVVRKKQRFQKREGYTMVARPLQPTVPADVYNGTAITSMPPFAEAVAGHRSASGSKLMTVADSKMYEYVGASVQREFRYVNDVPMALGTIVPVDTAAGSCLEIESCIISGAGNTSRLRVTAWTVGPRSASMAADDSMWSQDIDGGGLYLAIQREDTGAFVSPPRIIRYASGAVTTEVRNLRMCECYTDPVDGPNGEISCIIMWQTGKYGSAAELYAIRVTFDGFISSTNNITNLLAPQFRNRPPTWRSFDIAPYRINDPTQTFRFCIALCTDDPDAVGPEIIWAQVNAGPLTLPWALTLNVAVFNTATTGRTWFPRCMRGVTLGYDHTEVIGGDIIVTARVGISDTNVGSDPIDMALVMFRMQPAGVDYAPFAGAWAIVRDMNYQTNENFTRVPGYAGSGAKGFYSKTVTQLQASLSTADSVNGAFPVVSTRYSGPYMLQANLPGTTPQLYTYALYDVVSGVTRKVASITGPYFPDAQLTQLQRSQWGQVSHAYPLSGQIDVRLDVPAVYATGTQLSRIDTPNCGPDNITVAIAGYYPSQPITATTLPGSVIVTQPTADVWISGGINVTSVAPFAPAGTGLTNGVYTNVPLVVGGVSTARGTVTVAGGSITTIAVNDSGIDYAVGAGLALSIAVDSLYQGSPAFPAITVCNVDNYACAIVPITMGVITLAPFPPAGETRGAITTLGGGLGALTINAPCSVMYFDLINTDPVFSFKDGGDTTVPAANPAFDQFPQDCVHRWSCLPSRAADGSNLTCILAITSVGANPFVTPSGDAATTQPFVLSTCNYFEVYKWDGVSAGEVLLRPRVGMATTNHGISALAGPWRMTSDLVAIRRPDVQTTTEANGQRIVVGVTPAGDRNQYTSFLVYIGDIANTMVVVSPSHDKGVSSLDWVYANNPGMFVESCNAPRTLTVAANTSRMFKTTVLQQYEVGQLSRTISLVTGVARDGSVENVSQIGSMDYNLKPEAWRQSMAYADYTLTNGGVVTSFDGSSASELCPFVWPQQALCSIAFSQPTKLYDMGSYSSQGGLIKNAAFYGMIGGGANTVAALTNITRPYFMYESGLKDRALASGPVYPSPREWAWESITTSFGGRATDDYQAITVDQRFTAFNMNIAGASNTPGGQRPSYFYGKYGRSAESNIRERFVFWGPRNTSEVIDSNTGSVLSCSFNEAEASGDMLMRWTYEYTDGTGRVVRSAPSVPSRYNIISWLGTDDDNLVTSAAVFKYGFFAPRLELSNRLRLGADDNRRVTTQPYTSCEPYGGIFYMMPLQNWETPAKSFISERGSGRELCPFSSAPYNQSTTPFGYVTSNLSCFHGKNASYLGLLSMPYLYTAGNVVPNACPPSTKCMTIHKNRIVLGGADDPTVIWISKEMTETEAPAFSDLFTMQIADGGAVTGLGSLSRALIVFKSDQIHLLTGDMPDNAVAEGLTASLGQPYRLVNGLGCVSHRSVISTPVGVFFQSMRGIELMGQDLAITPIGLRVMDIMATYSQVVSVTHKAVDSEVVFCCQKPSVIAGTNNDQDGSQFILLVYNYADHIWARHEMDSFGFGAATVGEQDDQTLIAVGGRVYKTSDTQFYDKTTAGDVWVPMSGETAPIALHERQGYQRVKRIVLMGDPLPALPAQQVIRATA